MWAAAQPLWHRFLPLEEYFRNLSIGFPFSCCCGCLSFREHSAPLCISGRWHAAGDGPGGPSANHGGAAGAAAAAAVNAVRPVGPSAAAAADVWPEGEGGGGQARAGRTPSRFRAEPPRRFPPTFGFPPATFVPGRGCGRPRLAGPGLRPRPTCSSSPTRCWSTAAASARCWGS